MYIYIKKSPPFPSPLRRSWDGRVMERGEGSYVEALPRVPLIAQMVYTLLLSTEACSINSRPVPSLSPLLGLGTPMDPRPPHPFPTLNPRAKGLFTFPKSVYPSAGLSIWHLPGWAGQ